MKKKLFALYLSIAMLGAFCSCAAANDSDEIPPTESTVEESTEKESETTAVETETTDTKNEEVNEYGFTKTQLESIYTSIKNSVLTGYLEPNNIALEDFKWPEYEKFDMGVKDEDFSWDYLDAIFTNYLSSGELYDSSGGLTSSMPNDTHCKLMNSVLDGIVNWIELPENASVFPPLVQMTLSPLGDVIPANVTFDEISPTETTVEESTEKESEVTENTESGQTENSNEQH